MTFSGVPRVKDVVALVSDGEVRTFDRACAPDASAPDFYRIASAGEFSDGRPAWINGPKIGLGPHPGGRGRDYRPLSDVSSFDFRARTIRARIGDFYGLTPSVFLISEKVLGVVATDEPGLEQAPARLWTADGGAVGGYYLVMPRRVLDAVDVSRTNVVVSKQEPVPGSPGRYVTQINYRDGYVVRADSVGTSKSFLEEYSGHWLWRRDLAEAVRSTGARGIRAEFTSLAAPRPEIRF